MKKTLTSLLILYISFFKPSFSQNIYLKIDSKTEAEKNIIDSIGYKNQFKDITDLKLEKKNLESILYKLGYIESKETSSVKTNDSTFLSTYLLYKRYKAIHIYYGNNSKIKNFIKSISEERNEDYFSIPFIEIEDKLNFINQQLANEGSPFKTLQLKNIQTKRGNILKAELYISEDSKRLIDNIIIKGYEKFPKSFLKRYLKIKLKDTFNLDKINNKTESLDQLSFTTQIKSTEVLFTEDSTTLYIYLEKRASNTFDGFLGFGTNEVTNKIEFDGYLNLNLINNLNYGESLRLLYKSDENDQNTFQTQIELPYLFGSPIGSEIKLNIFKKDSSFTTINQSAKLFYQINAKSKILVGLNSTQSNNLLETNTSSIIDDYNSNFYNIGYNYTLKENYNNLFPLNLSLNFEAGTGRRTFENTSLKQTSIIYDAFKIFNLNQKNSIYIRSNGSFLFSDNYFFNELYRFGGINSIRGFEENSLYASLFALINTEYRYKISNSIYINSIIDAAYFENSIPNTKEKLFGFGFGFGLLTNSGLLKFNYANGKSENKKFKFSDSKIHLSLTAQF